MLRTEHPSELPQRRLERRVRQGVIVFHRLRALPLAEDHQRFFGAVATPALGLHANLHRLDHQRPLLARPNLDPRPVLRRLHPAVRTLERDFRRLLPNRCRAAEQRPDRGPACWTERPADTARSSSAIHRENRCFGPFRRPRSPRRAATPRDACESFPRPAHAACET